jgi:hypothetical protein
MNRPVHDWHLFSVAIALASGPPLVAAYDVKAAPLFACGLLLWGLLPIAIAAFMFRAKRWYAAWGWLVAVSALNYFVLASFLQSHSSTAILDFLWAPAWGVVLVGPVGAGVFSLLARFVASNRTKEK